MLTSVNNIHRHTLPKLGAIGRLIMRRDPWTGKPSRYVQDRGEHFIVEAFPLSDAPSAHSRGIHTAYFRSLADGVVVKASGFYFDEEV